MNRRYLTGNAILWAAAILASAILHAPVVLTLMILPTLAVGALVILRPTSGTTTENGRHSPCR